ncbi:MAG TPA: L-serine ammonia-lyase, iron-sulfur-dependent, subunit alpha, partial [Rectinemataceae bacterium]|nr:L-serine ammonia-lyase, iron-sulfur-dependent, subunit alpha [Rectinemataceae bacterium]
RKNNSIILILHENEVWMDSQLSATFIAILREELFPALGCTEPISIALAAAKAREVLGVEPVSIVVRCSGNLIKNAKSVFVPNTGGLKGIAASAIAGMIAGDSSRGMQVLAALTDADRARIALLLGKNICSTKILEGEDGLHIILTMRAQNGDSSLVEIIHTHTNISRVERNGETLFFRDFAGTDYKAALTDRSGLSIERIFDFARAADMEPLNDLIAMQIECNKAIAAEGLRNTYGLNIGNAVLEVYGDSVWARIRANAAAGSDARMNGCGMPVVINSGSGNQGMTASLPLILYAESMGSGKDTLYRALVLSNLVTIRIKAEIGRMSAYCGAISASAGAAAGITYLAGGTLAQIEAAIVNTLSDVSGIVCDGAKASCAAKIATGIDAAILAHHLAMRGKVYESGAGLVKDSVEKTIDAIGRLGHVGMKETDAEILRIMLAD